MTVSEFFIPSHNILGPGALDQAMPIVGKMGFKKALIITDADLAKLGMAQLVADKLTAQGIDTAIFDKVQPNPTVGNVNAGLDALKAHGADLIVSRGGGSSHDCAKGVALVASNGGKIADYEGVDKSAKPQLPLLAINTTAGTASEMTRFTIITDETRHVKMAIIDRHITPFLSVNDSDLMEGMPASLTAATGMDALTHAVEAYVSTIATPITDACALQAVRLMRLHAGAEIHPHRDPGLGIEHGLARLHLPVRTHEAVGFLVDGERRPMQAGELWYFNADQVHEVWNRGDEDRIHLVIDCIANPWLVAKVQAGDPRHPAAG